MGSQRVRDMAARRCMEVRHVRVLRGWSAPTPASGDARSLSAALWTPAAARRPRRAPRPAAASTRRRRRPAGGCGCCARRTCLTPPSPLSGARGWGAARHAHDFLILRIALVTGHANLSRALCGIHACSPFSCALHQQCSSHRPLRHACAGRALAGRQAAAKSMHSAI